MFGKAGVGEQAVDQREAFLRVGVLEEAAGLVVSGDRAHQIEEELAQEGRVVAAAGRLHLLLLPGRFDFGVDVRAQRPFLGPEDGGDEQEQGDQEERPRSSTAADAEHICGSLRRLRRRAGGYSGGTVGVC